jgi:hypothetical protein
VGVGDRFGSIDGVLEGWGCERMEVDVQVRCVGPDLAICLVQLVYMYRIPIPSIVCGCS